MTSGREMTVKSSGTVLGSSVLMNNWLMKTVCQAISLMNLTRI